MDTQRCPKCCTNLPEDAFYPSGWGRRGQWCRNCNKVSRRQTRSFTCIMCSGAFQHVGRGHPKNCPKCRAEEGFASAASLRRARVAGRPERKRTWTPGSKRAWYLRSKYGLTPEGFDAILRSQGGHCAGCDATPTDGKPLQVDHDHSCCPGDRSCGQCVRGLLCGNCNKALGLLRDDSQRLHRLLDYISGTLPLAAAS